MIVLYTHLKDTYNIQFEIFFVCFSLNNQIHVLIFISVNAESFVHFQNNFEC